MRLAHTFSRAIAALGIFTVLSFAVPAAAHADDSVDQLTILQLTSGPREFKRSSRAID